MDRQNEILIRFCWEHPEYVHRQPTMAINLWGDIMMDGRIIATSDLHDLPLDRLGSRMPTRWTCLK